MREEVREVRYKEPRAGRPIICWSQVRIIRLMKELREYQE